MFHLFEVLHHLLGTELQGTSVLHETSTGSTTTQHSLLHTRHGHAVARMGLCGQQQSCCRCSLRTTSRGPPTRQDFALGSAAAAVQEPRGVSEAWGEKPQLLRHPASWDGSSPELGHPHTWVLTHPVPVFRHLVLSRCWSPGPCSGHLTQTQSLDGAAGALGHPSDDEEQAGCRAAGAGAAASGHGGQRLPLLP